MVILSKILSQVPVHLNNLTKTKLAQTIFSFLIHDLLFLPISIPIFSPYPYLYLYPYPYLWSELTCRNSLSHSRLACSRLSAHIQLSVNNPDTNGAAKLLNTTRQYNYNGHLVRPLSTVE